MKRYLISITIAALSLVQVHAQTVKWTVSSEQAGEDLFKVIVKGQVAEGMHIYDSADYLFGATPTRITVSGENIEPVGELRIVSKVDKAYDDILDTELGTMSGLVVFEQDVKLKERPAQAHVEISWLACTETDCSGIEDAAFDISIGSRLMYYLGLAAGIATAIAGMLLGWYISKKRKK
ncbi:MAG: hypothetical protein MJZ07_03700 [Bacteroidales bacterium]|nr:hypothetical protein [Bacteroidales bacterium]